MMIICFIIISTHPVLFAMMSVDIDENGRINLKDCLQILREVANSYNEISVKKIQGLPLIKGTYSQVRNSEKTTFTFNENGTCVRVGPDGFGKYLTTEGTWHYENDSLHINTSGEIMIYVAVYKVNIDEYYKAAFTNEDGSKLIMSPPAKNLDQMPDVLGRYSGEGEVLVTLPEFSFGNRTIIFESITDVKPEGSWETTITLNDTGKIEIEKYQGVFDLSMPIIYVFGNSFYPDPFSDDTQSVYFERE